MFAEELSGRPLSDVAFLIKEGARLTAKAGKDQIDNESLEEALDGILNQSSDRDEKQNRMGFIRE
jgi:ATP-dependent Zn protease